MGWFSDTSLAPKIRQTYSRNGSQPFFTVVGGTVYRMRETVKTITDEIVGLTQAAAEASADYWDSQGYRAVAQRMNAAGGYKVVVTSDSSAWSADPI